MASKSLSNGGSDRVTDEGEIHGSTDPHLATPSKAGSIPTRTNVIPNDCEHKSSTGATDVGVTPNLTKIENVSLTDTPPEQGYVSPTRSPTPASECFVPETDAESD